MRKLLSVFAILFGLCGFIAACSPGSAGEVPITLSDRMGILIVAGVPFLTGCFFLCAPVYNRLMNSKNLCEMALSNIDILLERRHDVLDNLIAVSERYASHENSVLVDISRHRSNVGSGSLESAMTDAGETYGSRMLAVAEAYPELKADQAFARYSQQLDATENGIALSRREYNEAVLNFNNLMTGFPDLVIARLFQFQQQPFFQGNAKHNAAPRVGRLR